MTLKHLIILTSILVLGSATTTSAVASTSRNAPSSIRGYYISKDSLLRITKHTISASIPQADNYPYHIAKVSRHGKKYKIKAYINMGGNRTASTYNLKKVNHHKIHLKNVGTLHRVTKKHFYYFARHGHN